MSYQDLFYRRYGSETILQRRLEVSQTIVKGIELLRDFRAVPEATKYGWFRRFIHELVWKHSEIRQTSKYIGCQFWSLQAANTVLERKIATGKTLLQVIGEMQNQTDQHKITHEHVYPIMQFCRDLLSEDPDVNYLGVLTSDNPVGRISSNLSRLAIGCIVLENGEHRDLNRIKGVRANPWERYAQAGIRLVPNSWPDCHPSLIEAAGVAAGEAALDPRFR